MSKVVQRPCQRRKLFFAIIDDDSIKVMEIAQYPCSSFRCFFLTEQMIIMRLIKKASINLEALFSFNFHTPRFLISRLEWSGNRNSLKSPYFLILKALNTLLLGDLPQIILSPSYSVCLFISYPEVFPFKQ